MSINDQIKSLNKKISKLQAKKRGDKCTEEDNRELQSLIDKCNNLHEIYNVNMRLGDPIIEVICRYFNVPKGRGFKTYVTFQELISYKAQQQKRKEDIVFKQYISFIDTLQDKLKLYYPFIDFSGIDLNWTTDQLIEFVVDVYFTRPVCTVDEILKTRQEQEVEFLSENIIKKLNQSVRKKAY